MTTVIVIQYLLIKPMSNNTLHNTFSIRFNEKTLLLLQTLSTAYPWNACCPKMSTFIIYLTKIVSVLLLTSASNANNETFVLTLSFNSYNWVIMGDPLIFWHIEASGFRKEHMFSSKLEDNYLSHSQYSFWVYIHFKY